MKKLVFGLLLAFSLYMQGQNVGDSKVRSIAAVVADATAMNAITGGRLTNGTLVYREDTKTYWLYDVDTWKDTGLGPAGVSGAHTIQSNGTPQTQQPNLDFTSPFTVTNDAGNSKTVVGFDDAAYVLVDGSRAFTGNLALGNNNITGIRDVLPNTNATGDLGSDSLSWSLIFGARMFPSHDRVV